MKNFNRLFFLYIFLSYHVFYSQNTLTYSPLSQTVSAGSGVEVVVSVMVNCYGTSSSPLAITPTSCAFDNGFIGISYTNGVTHLTPGNSTTLKFRFKKTVTTAHSFNYTFSTNYTCGQSESQKIKILVNYLYTPVVGETCLLPPPQNFNVTEVTTTSIKVNWSHLTGASSYLLYYKKSGSSGLDASTFINYNSHIQNATINGLEPGTQYYISLIGRCSNNVTGSVPNSLFVTTLCEPDNPPTNLQATVWQGGYSISYNMINPTGCYLEYHDLDNNATGTTQVGYSTTPTYDNFFYYIPMNHSFRFRLKGYSSCSTWSEWKTISPQVCPVNNYPNNLVVSSMCSYPGHSCGYAVFSWSAIPDTTLYNCEYTIINLTNTNQSPINGSFQTTNNLSTQVTPYSSGSGVWIIKMRVRSRCVSGSWSDFSSWSANFAW